MVECEFDFDAAHGDTIKGFNRYMVECESASLYASAAPLGVLIDTWWNVNSSLRNMYSVGQTSFNRYMVECEFISLGTDAAGIVPF